ncbi:MAG: hypothetical protein WDA71_04605 [Actinomycetota bacterium]
MARNWMAIRVNLMMGRDIICDPPPGRTMIVGPSHTFADLAKAIDAAFARWDLAHLHMFELPDGRLVGEPDPNWDLEVLDETSLKVKSNVGLGDRFKYVFDLGDEWRHECDVGAVDVDPAQSYGIVPRTPVAVWGWGWIPDQYGRRSEDDAGEEEWEFRWVRVSDDPEGDQ